MGSLIEIKAAEPGTGLALAQQEAEAAHAFALAEKAPATRRAYDSDFAMFSAWCDHRGASPLPAAPEAVAAFLAYSAQAGAKPSTISRRLAAIRYAHALAGLEPPTSAEGVRATLRGIRRTIGAAKAQKAPATAERVAAMAALAPATLRGLRDRAILLFGFAGAFRRSELVALQVEDLTETPDGLRVRIAQSKTDQEGQGQEVAIPNGTRLRPVEALQAWIAAAGTTEGPIFRRVAKSGRVLPGALAAESVADIVKHYARAAGFDPAAFAGHSLRAGFLTSGAERGASIFKLMEVSRHKSVDTLRSYVRRAELFKDHAGAGFL
ncbi:MAG TPA: site-specific integrase [Acetobacteraceae bacterium]|nr:site-specific integrase [Acetobacteraceae bacterium]